MASRNLTTLAFVQEMMKKDQLPIWRAYHSDGKTVLCTQDTKTSIAESIDLLRDLVKNTSGIIVLKLYKDPEADPNSKKNQYSFYEFTIDLDADPGKGSTAQDTGIGGISGNNNSLLALFLGEMSKNQQLQIEGIRKEFEYKTQLEQASKSSEAQKNQMQMMIMNRLMNVLDPKGTAPATPPPVSSFNQAAKQAATVSGIPPEERKKKAAQVTEILNRLAKDDPTFYEKLAKLAEMKEKNPEMYGTVTGTLNGLEF